MTIAALIPLLLGCQGTRPDPLPAPTLPAGCTAEFQEAAFSIEKLLQSGDFEAAKRSLWMLPQRSMTIDWEVSKLPAAMRDDARAELDSAIKEWKYDVCGLNIEVKHGPGGLKIDFEKVLGISPESHLPLGMALIFSQAPGDPRLEAVIGLQRGNPSEPTTRLEIGNEIRCAIGSYLGLSPSPFFGTFMGRTDQPTGVAVRAYPQETFEARAALGVAELLAKAASNGQRVSAGQPNMMLDSDKLDLPSTMQGVPADFAIQVSNRGTAPMSFRLTPDCSCFAVMGPGIVPPGANVLVRGRMNTEDYYGDVHKALVLATSDPSRPMVEIPLQIHIQPRYRLIAPTGIYGVASSNQFEYDVYLCVTAGSTIVPSGVRLDGIRGDVTFVPWSGELADPGMHEPAQPRKGWKFMIRTKGDLPPGRVLTTLNIATTNKDFHEVFFSFYIQKGIVALPDRLYFGEMGAQPLQGRFVLSRPESGFNVLKIESESPNLTVTQLATRGTWEHEFTVKYDGKAISGQFSSLVHVTTNDPKQPIITVLVDGVVK